MKIRNFSPFVIALFIGAALGYVLHTDSSSPVADESDEYQAKEAVADKSEEASIKALRARIRELERQLGEKGEPVAEVSIVQDGRGDRPGARNQGASPREWRERMKKENPEGYIAMTNGIARWRQERLDRAQKKVDFFSSIDTSRMSPAARKVHEDLQDLIAKREEFEQKMHDMQDSDVEMSHEDRHAMFTEMRQIDDQIRELNAKERQNLMLETAKNLGFNAADAGEIAETFQEIIENTEAGWNPTGRPGRGGRNGGGNRGFPPPSGR